MASIKVKFKPSTIADNEGIVFYQILHERKQRQVFSDYHVFPFEWDEDRSMVTTTRKSERKSFILSIRERIRWDVERLTKIIRRLDNNGLDYSTDDVVEEFNRYANEYSMFNYMESIIIQLKQNENKGNSPNTISFYTRILRAAYKRAVDDEIIEDRNPFRRVYTGIDKTVKRALPLPIIKKIKALDLSLIPEQD